MLVALHESTQFLHLQYSTPVDVHTPRICVALVLFTRPLVFIQYPANECNELFTELSRISLLNFDNLSNG
jgi:hypothetical protein